MQHAQRFCQEGTLKKILEDINEWASNADVPSSYWICDMAGTGKSTIAMSTCKNLDAQGSLAGSFFCS
jgi:adenylylsulfate kinase-like enzyme